jgi:hypothetical protein
MTTRNNRRRVASVLCAAAMGGALFALSGSPAEAAGLPVADIVGSGSGVHFNPGGFEAEYLPPQCPGYHAGFAVINYSLAPQVIQYYGGRVTIPFGVEHIFCIGGTANGYQIEYQLLGTVSLLHIAVP